MIIGGTTRGPVVVERGTLRVFNLRAMKQRPNHRLYLAALRQMGAEERLRKAFELSEFCRVLMRRGLERAHPEMSPTELQRLYESRMAKARSRQD